MLIIADLGYIKPNIMKNIGILVFAALLIISCKIEEKGEANDDGVAPTLEGVQYPEALGKVFEAHGGLSHWNTMNSLTYEIKEDEAKEKHSNNLKTRKHLVETKGHTIGADGKQVWLLDPEGDYEGNARFYHNLFFYFHAMPFVLADDGINYAEAEPLVFQDKTYPGILISYGENIGDSPDDEYYLYYNPETFQMEWLGYTVTYGKDGKSDNVKWIRYDDWKKTNGLLLPNSMTWYTYEGRTINEPRNTMVFKNVEVSEEKIADAYFEMPEEATALELEK